MKSSTMTIEHQQARIRPYLEAARLLTDKESTDLYALLLLQIDCISDLSHRLVDLTEAISDHSEKTTEAVEEHANDVVKAIIELCKDLQAIDRTIDRK